jgi:zinc/manganese transport system permease protein
MLDNLDLGILLPAFLAGLLVISTHVPLGQRVLARGIVFIDLAIAQVAGLGVILADFVGWEAAWQVQVAAAIAALLGAALLTWTERRWPEVQEALIGVLFVAAASVELLLLAHNPHGGEHLKDLLVGQILWVRPTDLLPVAVLYAAILAIWFGFYGGAEANGKGRAGQVGFYVLFALTVTQSVQLVGIYLVFATLILPALAVRKLANGQRLLTGYLSAIGGYIVGLLASAAFDLPTGPVIVVALLLAFIATAAFRKVPV